MDAEAREKGLMVCRTSTTLLSSRLVSGGEGGVGEDGDEELCEEAGER